MAEPYRAWAIFSFTAASGRTNECDLFVAVPGGLYLVELKGHPGHVVNNGETWSFREPGSHRTLTLRNPLHLTDLKSKELKHRLDWAAKQLGVSEKIPRVEPAILFHHKHSDLRLDAYLAVHGDGLTPEIRLDLVRQLAEAVRYAHHRSLYHRALAARSVYVSARGDGSAPVLRIADWQAAARDFDTTTQPSIGDSSLTGEHLGDPPGCTWLRSSTLPTPTRSISTSSASARWPT